MVRLFRDRMKSDRWRKLLPYRSRPTNDSLLCPIAGAAVGAFFQVLPGQEKRKLLPP